MAEQEESILQANECIAEEGLKITSSDDTSRANVDDQHEESSGDDDDDDEECVVIGGVSGTSADISASANESADGSPNASTGDEQLLSSTPPSATASNNVTDNDHAPPSALASAPSSTHEPTSAPGSTLGGWGTKKSFSMQTPSWMKPLWTKKQSPSNQDTPNANHNSNNQVPSKAIPQDHERETEHVSQVSATAPNTKRGSNWDGINKSLSTGLKDFSSAMVQIAAAVETTFVADTPSTRKPGESADLFNASFTEVIADLGKDIASGIKSLATAHPQQHPNPKSTTNSNNRRPSASKEVITEHSEVVSNELEILEFHQQIIDTYDDEFNRVESVQRKPNTTGNDHGQEGNLLDFELADEDAQEVNDITCVPNDSQDGIIGEEREDAAEDEDFYV